MERVGRVGLRAGSVTESYHDIVGSSTGLKSENPNQKMRLNPETKTENPSKEKS